MTVALDRDFSQNLGVAEAQLSEPHGGFVATPWESLVVV